jgi:hypothetical protein
MAENKEVNYLVVPKQKNFKVIEEKVFDYKNGPEVAGYKIKVDEGEFWLSKNEFHLIFKKEIDLF